jgi:hypothetical protein
MSRGAACPDKPPTEADQPQTRCTASRLTPIQPIGSPARARPPDVQKRAMSCMITARSWLQCVNTGTSDSPSHQPSPKGLWGRSAHRLFLLGVQSRYGLHTRGVTVYRDTLTRGLQPLRYLHDCSGCFRTLWGRCRHPPISDPTLAPGRSRPQPCRASLAQAAHNPPWRCVRPYHTIVVLRMISRHLRRIERAAD